MLEDDGLGHSRVIDNEMPEDECRSHRRFDQKFDPEAVSGRVGFVSSRFCSEIIFKSHGHRQTRRNDPCAALVECALRF